MHAGAEEERPERSRKMCGGRNRDMKLGMLGVKAILKIALAVLATWAFVAAMASAPALARSSCVRSAESLALRAAAIQQKLMVAALYCRDVGRYNRFVLAYRRELQDSDAVLMAYFRRSGAGEAGYHAYKTRLANAFSMAGIREQERFCEGARAVFDTAHDTPRLATLVFALPDARVAERNDCPDVREAHNGDAPSAKPAVPVAAAGMGGSFLSDKGR
jgi:hypothetical protein